jgi:ABC-type nitrate/sulfonate/bicarbonate transport system permease component
MVIVWVGYANYDHWSMYVFVGSIIDILFRLFEYIQNRDTHLYSLLKQIKLGSLLEKYQKPSL